MGDSVTVGPDQIRHIADPKVQAEADAKAAAEAKVAAEAKRVADLARANPAVVAGGNSADIVNSGGKDMTGPGVEELAFHNYAGNLVDPSEGKMLYDQVGGAFKRPGKSEVVGGAVADQLGKGTQGGTYGQDFYEGLVGSGKSKDPGMIDAAWKNMQGVSANMDPYYDLAFQDSQRQINQAAMARGGFASSGTMRSLTEASTRLNAQQAKDEATYKLDRAKAMGDLAVSGTEGKASWMTSMGDLAFNAADERREYGTAASDAAKQAQDSEQNRLTNAFNATMGIDTTEINASSVFHDAAAGAQDAREGRIKDEMDYNLKIAQRLEEIYASAMGVDVGKGDTGVATGLAATEDERRLREAEAEKRQQEYLDALGEAGEAFSTGSGGTGAKP